MDPLMYRGQEVHRPVAITTTDVVWDGAGGGAIVRQAVVAVMDTGAVFAFEPRIESQGGSRWAALPPIPGTAAAVDAAALLTGAPAPAGHAEPAEAAWRASWEETAALVCALQRRTPTAGAADHYTWTPEEVGRWTPRQRGAVWDFLYTRLHAPTSAWITRGDVCQVVGEHMDDAVAAGARHG